MQKTKINVNPQLKAQAKAKPKDGDNTLAYSMGIGLVCMVISFVVSWAYWHPARVGMVESDVAFASVGPIHIETQGYTFRANLAIQTGPDDARWALNNKKQLKHVLERALTNADPRLMRTPAGLRSVQESLKKTVNATLSEERVKNVLFTDFVIQED